MATTKTKIGNLFFNFRGDWKSTETYIKDDVVMYNNSDYICVKNTDSTNDVPKENKRRYVRLTKAVAKQLPRPIDIVIAISVMKLPGKLRNTLS